MEVMASWALAAPGAVGEKRTWMVQTPPAGSAVLVQVSAVMLNRFPVMRASVTVRVPGPLLVMVTLVGVRWSCPL